MKTMKICLNSMERVKKFINGIAKVDGATVIFSEHGNINAKSVMGIFTLDLTKPLELEIDNWREEYMGLIGPFCV